MICGNSRNLVNYHEKHGCALDNLGVALDSVIFPFFEGFLIMVCTIIILSTPDSGTTAFRHVTLKSTDQTKSIFVSFFGSYYFFSNLEKRQKKDYAKNEKLKSLRFQDQNTQRKIYLIPKKIFPWRNVTDINSQACLTYINYAQKKTAFHEWFSPLNIISWYFPNIDISLHSSRWNRIRYVVKYRYFENIWYYI